MSATGDFAERESKRRFADILIDWPDTARVHVEVKIDDANLEKTFDTARLLERRFGTTGCTWEHYIVLPSRRLPEWRAFSARTDPSITVISWEDIARALRRAWQDGDETLSWRVWAWTFTGAIERLLLSQLQVEAVTDCDLKFKSLSRAVPLQSMLYTRDAAMAEEFVMELPESAVAEGFRRFGDAWATTRAVAALLASQLESHLKCMESWSPLSLSRIGVSWALPSTKTETSVGCICVATYGDKSIEMQVAMAWQSPEIGFDYGIYARLRVLPGNWLKPVDLGLGPSIKIDQTRYYRELSPTDSESVIRRHTHELVRALLDNLPLALGATDR